MSATVLLLFLLAPPVYASVLNVQSVSTGTGKNETAFGFREACYGELGCFTSGGDFFHPVFRPIDLLPQDREKINTRFHLYTRDSPKDFHFLKAGDDESLEHFATGKPLKVIVHGYLDNQLFGKWMKDMKDELLFSDDMNVVIVDWSGGNSLPYIQASANCRLVGAEIAHLLTWLQAKRVLNLGSAHILGHSLGSHVAGYAGERLVGLGRITAMDPAEPYFQYMPENVRIDPSDANLVDVVHTDTKTILLLGLGMSQLVGHVDVFPNGGREQPGCALDKITSIITEGLVEGVRNFVACNHQRAVSYVHDSINRHKCLPVAFHCPDWSSFQNGQCGNCGPDSKDCTVLGYKSDQYKSLTKSQGQKSFYIMTNSDPPYCLYHYQVILDLEEDSKDQDGLVKVRIRGSEMEEDFTLGDSKIELNGGEKYHFLLTTKNHLGEIKGGVLYWEVKRLIPPIIAPKLRVKTLTIRPMNEIMKTKEYRYCLSNHPITSKKTLTLSSVLLCENTKKP